jgi:hypothetical protein
VRELLTANPHDLHTDQFAQRPQSSALSRLGEIRVPTLIIVGEHDIPDVHAHAGAIEAGIARSRREVVSNAAAIQSVLPSKLSTRTFCSSRASCRHCGGYFTSTDRPHLLNG